MRQASITLSVLLLASACGRAEPDAPASRRPGIDTVPVAGTDTVFANTRLRRTAVPAAVDTTRSGAVGCQRTDTPRPVPDSVLVQDLRGGARLTCVLRRGHPPVQAWVDTEDDYGWVVGVRVSAPDWPQPWSQSIAAEAEGSLYRGVPVLEAIDYDRDGWADLRTQQWAGATGNVKYHVFRFDPRRQRFARDSVLSETISADTLPGPPCVRGHYHAGGRSYSTWTICLEQGRWVEVASESQFLADGQRLFVRERSARRGGRMVVIHTDTLTPDEVWAP